MVAQSFWYTTRKEEKTNNYRLKNEERKLHKANNNKYTQ